MNVFDELESEVRSYCRSFPTVFTHASGARLFDERDCSYIDFWSGAGVLNYGHNPQTIKRAIIQYLEDDGITHSLDTYTSAKREFLSAFESTVLAPRNLRYKMQFPGPTGTNAIEAALKLARKVTGRRVVISFRNGFHGMTLGSLAVTSNDYYRQAAGVALEDTVELPFCGAPGTEGDSLEFVETYLDDHRNSPAYPAAILLETVQAEGGVNAADFDWLERLEALARSRDVLLVVDDIQVGCGRTGPFFSFEPAGIEPDIVCMSKAISGFGLPLSLVLLKPEHDVWRAGEHNGTFRGNNLAFVAAAQALQQYWRDDTLETAVAERGAYVRKRLAAISKRFDDACGPVRGRGLILGLPFTVPNAARAVSRVAFENGLVIETAGRQNEVVKLLPPLVINNDELEAGLGILDECVEIALSRGGARVQ